MPNPAARPKLVSGPATAMRNSAFADGISSSSRATPPSSHSVMPWYMILVAAGKNYLVRGLLASTEAKNAVTVMSAATTATTVACPGTGRTRGRS